MGRWFLGRCDLKSIPTCACTVLILITHHETKERSNPKDKTCECCFAFEILLLLSL